MRHHQLLDRLGRPLQVHAVGDREGIGWIAGAQEHRRDAVHLPRPHEMDQHLLAIGPGLNDLGPALDQKMAGFGGRTLTEDACSLRYPPDLPGVEDRVERSRVQAVEQVCAFEDRGVNHWIYPCQGERQGHYWFLATCRLDSSFG